MHIGAISVQCNHALIELKVHSQCDNCGVPGDGFWLGLNACL